MMLAMTESDAASEANAGSKLVSAIENATRSVLACAAEAMQASAASRTAARKGRRNARDNHRRFMLFSSGPPPVAAA
jgi:hypothetical protein